MIKITEEHKENPVGLFQIWAEENLDEAQELAVAALSLYVARDGRVMEADDQFGSAADFVEHIDSAILRTSADALISRLQNVTHGGMHYSDGQELKAKYALGDRLTFRNDKHSPVWGIVTGMTTETNLVPRGKLKDTPRTVIDYKLEVPGHLGQWGRKETAWVSEWSITGVLPPLPRRKSRKPKPAAK